MKKKEHFFWSPFSFYYSFFWWNPNETLNLFYNVNGLNSREDGEEPSKDREDKSSDVEDGEVSDSDSDVGKILFIQLVGWICQLKKKKIFNLPPTYFLYYYFNKMLHSISFFYIIVSLLKLPILSNRVKYFFLFHLICNIHYMKKKHFHFSSKLWERKTTK